MLTCPVRLALVRHTAPIPALPACIAIHCATWWYSPCDPGVTSRPRLLLQAPSGDTGEMYPLTGEMDPLTSRRPSGPGAPSCSFRRPAQPQCTVHLVLHRSVGPPAPLQSLTNNRGRSRTVSATVQYIPVQVAWLAAVAATGWEARRVGDSRLGSRLGSRAEFYSMDESAARPQECLDDPQAVPSRRA